MISRQWHGIVIPEHAEDYVRHLRNEIFPELTKISGFIEASIQNREVERGIEFLIVTTWESVDAIRQFAGSDADAAVVPEEVQKWMVDYDRNVSHYRVL